MREKEEDNNKLNVLVQCSRRAGSDCVNDNLSLYLRRFSFKDIYSRKN